MLFFILALLVYQDLPVFSKVGLKSEILKQERELWLYREASDYEKCPVLYLLDGKENFLTVVGIYQSLRRTNEIPPLMIVAVANIDREYDLSPSHIDVDYMKSGGGPNFHKFFKNELIPFIESKYPVTGHRTIVGHSLGAIFNLMLLTKDSGLFQNYLSISPSLWWDNQLISAELMQEVTKWDESKAALKLFMSMANEGSLADPNGKIMLDEYTKLKDFLTKSKRIAFNYRDNFTENHL
ncbi:MAG: alpha/beta hydrolase, partial [Calditrichaeota bacterium]|nr:alpha/beta hydrolase [Calditrichota bacterium]